MKVSNCILDFLKNWLLAVAMSTGTVIYLLFANVELLSPLKPTFIALAETLMPMVIFAMLFFTFCKINMHDLKPRRWHAETLVLQIVMSMAFALLVITFAESDSFADLVGEGIIACLISPTASAAAVVTGKLGGSAASLTSYTLESNIVSAVLITFICPLVHPMEGMHIINAFSIVLVKVSELLLLPFVMAVFVKHTWPSFHHKCASLKDIAFYLWGFSLTMVTGMTLRVVFANLNRPLVVLALVLGALVVCVAKFAFGRLIGGVTGKVDSISAGQALGQKNTMFTIWMALTYLNPIAAVAPGSYVLWQNIINSWELWHKAREDKRKAAGQNQA